MIVTVMEESHGVHAGSSRDGASRTEDDAEIDRQLELFMSRRSEVVNNLHILPTPSSAASDGPPNACNLHLIPMKDSKKLKSQVFGNFGPARYLQIFSL